MDFVCLCIDFCLFVSIFVCVYVGGHTFVGALCLSVHVSGGQS